jgi:hypothetical protein
MQTQFLYIIETKKQTKISVKIIPYMQKIKSVQYAITLISPVFHVASTTLSFGETLIEKPFASSLGCLNIDKHLSLRMKRN